MKKVYALLIACCIAQVLPAQDGMLSKKQFRKKVHKVFKNSGTITLLDTTSKLYIDSVLHLPVPVYKASAVMVNKLIDTFFFYYYTPKDIHSVEAALQDQWNYKNLRHYGYGPLPDSGGRFLIVYFSPLYIFKNPQHLRQFVVSAFKLVPPKVTVEDITIEEVVDEEEKEEPPPPPPPRKPAQKKPVKKKNPA